MPSFNCDPNVNTTGLTDLSNGWQNCTSIVSFPYKDFSAGLNFSYSWDGCSAMETFASQDLYTQLSNATEFVSTWENCNLLTSFQPNLNLGSATVFQLTWKDCSSLTNFPFTLVSAGVTFAGTWAGCTSLTSFPLLNTGQGVDFSGAWLDCSGLLSFPVLNTSQGTNFQGTWGGCSSLSSFPLLNTSQGTNFWFTWAQCVGLTSFPLLNTSQGTNFQSTWEQCSGLTSFPSLNLSQGINFSGTWLGCVSLADFPPNMFDSSLTGNFSRAWEVCALTPESIENIFVSLDTSGVVNGTCTVAGGTNACFGEWTALATAAYDNLIGKSWTIEYNDCPPPPCDLPPYFCNTSVDPYCVTNFTDAWSNCTSLTSFPLLNVSNGTNFAAAWRNCNSLTSFPLLNVSNGTNFSGAWYGCSNLTSFPLLDVSSGTNFIEAWYQCSSLTAFPLLNVSSGTSFINTWADCTSLITFPAGMFDTCAATNFVGAWNGCALTAQSIENILVSLDTSGVTGGTLSVDGGTNACSGYWTSLATAAYDSLIGKSWTIYYNDCPPPPPPAEALITLTASPTAVVNTGATSIIFSFTRTGSTANPLTVNFNVGGTATLGTDYTQSGAASFSPTSGSILIPAGQTTGQITIDPDPGASIVSSETVEITLVSGSGYTPVTTNPVVGTIYEDILPVAIQQTIYIRSILETIDGNLLTGEVNTPGPNPTLPVVSVPPVAGAGGPDYQIFELISDSIGSYGIFTLSSNGDFEYIVDLTNPIVLNLSPYTPPYYTGVSEPFQFRVTDLAGNTSEGVVNVSIQASYTRIAAAFTFDPIPPVPPNQGRKMWHLNEPLISTLSNPNYSFFGLNYPWTGPVTDPPPYITGYTDQPGNWLIGGPPPSGFFD